MTPIKAVTGLQSDFNSPNSMTLLHACPSPYMSSVASPSLTCPPYKTRQFIAWCVVL